MESSSVRSQARPILDAVMVAVTTMLAVWIASGAVAQTLTEPNPRTKLSPPRNAAKQQRSERVKSCSSVGPGFVNVPGTDACVKIGGSVDAEAMTSSGH